MVQPSLQPAPSSEADSDFFATFRSARTSSLHPRGGLSRSWSKRIAAATAVAPTENRERVGCRAFSINP